MPAFNAGPEAEFSGEQSLEDSRSTCFDSAPLDEPIVLCGRPVLHLTLRSNVPTAQICARLCEIRPNGESVRISYGLINLCLIDDANPEELRVGALYRFALKLDFLGYQVAAGSRIRLAISNSYWPSIWPTCEPGEQRLQTADCRIDLPMLASPASAFDLGDVALHATPTLPGRRELIPPTRDRSLSYRPFTGAAELVISDDNGRVFIEDSRINVSSTMEERHSLIESNPSEAQSQVRWQWQFDRDDWRAKNAAELTLRSTCETFTVAYTVRRWDGDRELAPVSGSETFSRKFH